MRKQKMKSQDLNKIEVMSIFLMISLFLFACKPDSMPTLAGVDDTNIELYTEFNPLFGVSAFDNEDGDLTDNILIINNVDTTVIGIYSVIYTVEDRAGHTITTIRSITVTELNEEDYPNAQYIDGIDLSILEAEDQAVLFAAAERYLLENVYAGVPLYTTASRVIYASRVQLFSEEYNSVLGFGNSFSRLLEDDSHVLMDENTYGKAGEYTWRTTYNTDPISLNPWTIEDIETDKFIEMYSGSLYDFNFDATKTGYELLPSLAASDPIPVNPVIMDGKLYSKIWRIELVDGLQWKFHPSTDISRLPAGYSNLDASDYLWTWQYALEHDWFRARTGGSDFVSQGILNASEFINGTATWNQVGLRLADDTTNTIELEYKDLKNMFEIKYNYASPFLAPVNQELFEELGETYGMTPEKIASSGTYYFDSWIHEHVLTFKKNNLHPDTAKYNYTGYQYRFIDGSDAIFAEFEAGRLDNSIVPNTRILEYISDPRIKAIPNSSVVRLNLNMLGTIENRDALIAAHPEYNLDESWVPEPILSYLPFRQALYYGFDRYYAAVELAKLYLPVHTIFTSSYFLDNESGLSLRGSTAGQAVVDDFGRDSHAYLPEYAIDLFKQAVNEAIADGYYASGTSENYTIISLELYSAYSSNTSVPSLIENLKQQYENLLVDAANFVKVEIHIHYVSYPDIYDHYITNANMDLGIGYLSSSYLCECNYLRMYSDDNPYGFLMNWGIDTSSANIPVAYHNLQGKMVYEMWSYNAIALALDGLVQVKDGCVFTPIR